MIRSILLCVVALVAGAALMARVVWERRGRSPVAREWSYSDAKGVTNAMLLRPGAGLALLGLAVLPWLDVPGLVVLFVLLFLPGLVIMLAGMVLPRVPVRILPAWAREPVGARHGAARESRLRRRTGRSS